LYTLGFKVVTMSTVKGIHWSCWSLYPLQRKSSTNVQWSM